ncbi:MAG: hypothetical protein ABIQ97_01925 [Lysobacteraceae bacterium]
MAHTLCFSGMDRAEEAKLKLLFADANEWLGGNWTLAPENTAEVLVIDVESMYGHMTWLKVHNSGRYIIAITSREESEAEHILLRPVTVESMVSALSQAVGAAAPTAPSAVSAGDALASAQQRQAAPAPEPPLPARTSQKNEPRGQQPAVPAPAAAAPTPPPPVATPPAAPAPPPPPTPPPPPPPQPPRAPVRQRDPVLWDYLQQGKLIGPSKLEIADAPALVIDPRTDTYIGGSALKPYIPYCELGSVKPEQWVSLSGAELNQLIAQLGEPQPLARLRWLHSIVQGGGELAPGYDPEDKFQLTRWPKTEREYPRHFRIATAMMQGPATLAEIAEQSNTTREEVTDFVNASLDSGFAELFVPPPDTPDASPKSGGLLGRFRRG